MHICMPPAPKVLSSFGGALGVIVFIRVRWVNSGGSTDSLRLFGSICARLGAFTFVGFMHARSSVRRVHLG